MHFDYSFLHTVSYLSPTLWSPDLLILTSLFLRIMCFVIHLV